MTTPTPKFCYHGNAADCCDACDREAIIERLKRDLAAAQEELERVRDKCNEHYMALAAAQEARQRAEEQVLSRIIGVATVGNIDGHEVIRRQSAIDVVRMVFAAIDAAREGK